MRKITLDDIAKAVNCSKVTVHKALNNQQGVSFDLRQKIIEVAKNLGYIQPLAIDKEANLNFIYLVDKSFMLKEDEQFYTAIYYYLTQIASANNCKVHLIIHNDIDNTISGLKNLIMSLNINGVFIGGQIDNAILAHLEKLNTKTVCIDFFSSDYNFDYIYVDNYYSSYLLTKYLIKRGHKSIGFVGDIKDSNAIADRYFGYRRALNKYNLEYTESNFYNFQFLQYKNIGLKIEGLPTAFICHCDKTAENMYYSVENLGLKIPQDVSIVSFDNTSICEILHPKMTSLGIDKTEYASIAYNLMLAKLDKLENTANYYKLSLKLNERDSVKNIT